MALEREVERVKDKELEKLEKYQLLKDEITKVWRMRKVIVVPVVIGAHGAVSVNFKKYMKQIGVNVWTWKSFRKQHCLGQQRYCPCKKKEKRDLGPWRLFVTRFQGL